MREALWIPSQQRVKGANVSRFIDFVNQKYRLGLRSYSDLYNWSIEKVSDFWASIWEFGEITYSRKYDVVFDDLAKFPGVKWFRGARLNFAQNLLKCRDEKPALISRAETGNSTITTYAQLYDEVSHLAKPLRRMGITAGDRIAAYMPTIKETTISMLASTSLGGVWTACGTELGLGSVLDRLGQVEPKVLFTVDRYVYKGRSFNVLPAVEKIAGEIPSLEKIVVVSYSTGGSEIRSLPNSVRYGEFASAGETSEIRFEQLPADHPVYIMFSSVSQ